MEPMSVFLVFAMLLQNFAGLLLPPLIDLINKRVAKPKNRFWVSFVFCVVVASVLNYQEFLDIKNMNDAALIVGKISFIFTQAQLVYKHYWEKAQPRWELFKLT